MRKSVFKVAVGSVALMSLSAGVASAAAKPAAWRPGPALAGATTAVTGVRASGITTEFAFVTNYSTHKMYVRAKGKTWTRKRGPGLAKGETIVEASAITAKHLIAFTVLPSQASRVLDYQNGKWKVIRRFAAPIGTATVLSARNIWVFGTAGARTLGVWHYNGKSWRRVGARAGDGSGATAGSAWAVRGTVVEHWVHGKWAGTNLARLIPKGQFGMKSLIGVYATPRSPVYAVGTGRAQDAGGPIAVLRLNGRRWTRVASYPGGYINTTAVSTDGRGGLILGGKGGIGGTPAELLHYAKGGAKLVAERVPGMTNAPFSNFYTAANVRGTRVLILGGVASYTRPTTIATIYTTN